MTPAQVAAELSEVEETCGDTVGEKARRKKIRDILQTVCMQQGIDASQIQSVPVSELARHVKAISGGEVDRVKLRAAVEEFAGES